MRPTRTSLVWRWSADRAESRPDEIAVEEPLELRVRAGDAASRTLSLLLRTPGHDRELVAGLLWAEGLLDRPGDLLGVTIADGAALAELAHGVDPTPWQRLLTTSAACGMCGRTSLELPDLPPRPPPTTLDPTLLADLPARLGRDQPGFALTGGLHATALFDTDGAPKVVREDVGRHNAFDKCVGSFVLGGALPTGGLGAVSGRASFELVQKALRAGLVALVAVGAPSSLAIDLARRHGLVLAGFARGGRLNVYAGAEQVKR